MLDECDVCGHDGSEDELEENTQLGHINDSIVCMTQEVIDPDDMHAMYLQSVRYNRNSFFSYYFHAKFNYKIVFFI